MPGSFPMADGNDNEIVSGMKNSWCKSAHVAVEAVMEQGDTTLPRDKGRFGDLPIELVEIIILKLPTRALSAFSRTCRCARQIAEKHLYADVRHSFALYRSVRNRPELARHVKRYSYDSANVEKHLPATDEEHKIHLETATDICNLFWQGFIQFKNLQSLCVGFVDWCTPMTVLSPQLMADIFPSLREVEIETRRYLSPTRLFGEELYQYLLHIPSLRSLVVRNRRTEWYNGPRGMQFDVSSQTTLTKVALEWTPLKVTDIERLLSACPELVDFRWYARVFFRQQPDYVDIGVVGKALRRAEKLERVDIRLQEQQEPAHYSDWFWGGSAETRAPWGIRGSIGPLDGLVRLKELRVPLCAMFGWEPPSRDDEGSVCGAWSLPGTLQKLILTQDFGDWVLYQWSPCETVDMCRRLLAEAGRGRGLPGLEQLEIRKTRRIAQRGCRKLWNPAALELLDGSEINGVKCDTSRYCADENDE